MLHTFLTQACRSCVWADWVQFHSVPEWGEQMGDLESYFPPISDPVLSPDQHLCFPSHHPHSFLLARLILFSSSQAPQGDAAFISTKGCYQKFSLGIVINDEHWSKARRRCGAFFFFFPLIFKENWSRLVLKAEIACLQPILRGRGMAS